MYFSPYTHHIFHLNAQEYLESLDFLMAMRVFYLVLEYGRDVV